MKETTKFDDFSGDKAISLAKTFAKDAYTKETTVDWTRERIRV